MARQTLTIKELKAVHGVLMGVVLGGLVFAVLHFMVTVPIKERKIAVDGEIAELAKEFQANEALLQATPKFREHYANLAERLAYLAEHQLVPAENPVRWGSTLISAIADQQGLAINEFSSSGTGQINTTRQTQRGTAVVPSPFEEFRVDLDLAGNYHQLGRFLAAIEARLPGFRVESLSLRARGRTRAEGLRISLRGGIPRFSNAGFPPDRPARANEGG